MRETRTFIAIRLTEEALEALRRTGERLRRAPGGDACRWADVNTIHLTLKFLGDVPDERLPAVCGAADRAAHSTEPLTLGIAGVGCFPNVSQPRVVWAGVRQGAEAAASLAVALDRELAREGFPREARPFKPHLTIARVRREARREEIATLGRTVAGWPADALAEVAVERLYVFGSELRSSGPVHTVLHVSPLGATGTGE